MVQPRFLCRLGLLTSRVARQASIGVAEACNRASSNGAQGIFCHTASDATCTPSGREFSSITWVRQSAAPPSKRQPTALIYSGFSNRSMHATAAVGTSTDDDTAQADTIAVTFVDKQGHEATVPAKIGKSLLEVAHENEIDLEGACEGSLACSTCHVIVEDEFFKKLPEASEDELDMLDLAFGLTDTSRLGCQIIASKDIDGIRVRIPSATRNFYVDGHKPKPH